MKFIKHIFRKVPYKVCLLALTIMFALEVPVHGLKMTKMPETMQNKVREPRERAISLKLPLLQPAFHWTFMSREDFLSGKLLLRIIRNRQSSEIVIFEKGKFADGWKAIPLPPRPDRGEIYFEFISTHRYLTAPGDRLELELTVKKDLPGIGAMQTGILPAGKYTAEGTYSVLIDEYDTRMLEAELAKEGKQSADETEVLLNNMRSMYEYKAFLESWANQWSLKITSQKGWLPAEKANALKAMRENLDRRIEFPAAYTDSVVINENPSRRYLWCWIAIPVVALFIVIFLRRAFAKPRCD